MVEDPEKPHKKDLPTTQDPITAQDPIQGLLTIQLNIDPHKDTYVIRGGAGVASAHIKKPTGEVHSAYVRAGGAFQQLNKYDPRMLSIQERRQLVNDLSRQGMTQTQIADLLGKSQATINLDLKSSRES